MKPSRSARFQFSPFAPCVFSGLFFVLLFSGCGGKKGVNSGPQMPLYPPLTPQVDASEALVIRAQIFAQEASLPNIAWNVPAGESLQSALQPEAPALVPGFHWEWSFGELLHVWARPRTEDHEWAQTGTLAEAFGTFPDATALAFGVDFTKVNFTEQWPAVVGGGHAQAFAGSLLTLSPVRPRDYQKPLQLRIEVPSESSLSALTLASQAPSCGDLCLEFENFPHALDSPFFVARSADHFSDQTSGAMRLIAFDRGGKRVADLDSCDQSWRLLAEKGGAMLETLRNRWGTPVASAGTYLAILQHAESGVGYQGLEHTASTLLMMSGNCGNTSYVQNALALLAHEIVHIWNVKHIIPAEHSQYTTASFDPERLRQLYLYEGWTEGFARILVRELAPDDTSMNFIRAWNRSLQDLYRQMQPLSLANGGETALGVRFDVAVGRNPFLHYETGAGLLLYMALHLANTQEEDQARNSFWDLIPRLAEVGEGSRARALAQPLWQRWLFEGGVGRLREGRDYSTGYTSEQVRELLNALTGNRFADFAEGVVLSRQELLDTLQAYAERTGMSLDVQSNGDLLFLSEQNVLAWPL